MVKQIRLNKDIKFIGIETIYWVINLNDVSSSRVFNQF